MRRESVIALVLDPTACSGRGMCHQAAPHLIDLDEWGYPILPGKLLRARITPADVKSAQDATHACPVLALHLERERVQTPDRSSAGRAHAHQQIDTRRERT